MRRRRRERGFALLIVLWSLGLLALLAAQLAATGRREAQLAANLRDAAVAEAAADGAVQDTIFQLLGAPGAVAPSGRLLRIGAAVIEVRVADEAGKVNPNNASAPLLQAMLRQCGAPGEAAGGIAAALVGWHTPGAQPGAGAAAAAQYLAAGRGYAPPGTPFESADEVGLVLGMTPALTACLVPHLSVWQLGDPAPALADPLVARALRETEGSGLQDAGISAADDVPVVRITAAARARRARFSRLAVARIGAGRDGRPYQILDWSVPGEPE